MAVKDFIAHIRTSDGAEQLLVDHLKEVQYIAENIGQKIGLKHVTGLAGMLHDMGKFSEAFQEYIRDAVANPSDPPKRGSVDHSTAGGKFLMEHFQQVNSVSPFLVECVSNAIFSHHGQLLDMVDMDGKSPFVNRLTSEKNIDFPQVKQRFLQNMYDVSYMNNYVIKAAKELETFFCNKLKNVKTAEGVAGVIQKETSFVTIFIFSALIDADRRNSRAFEEQEKITPFDVQSLWKTFEEHLNNDLIEKQKNSLPNEITRLRKQMSLDCLDKASRPTGIYTLSIPTGGGKTLASLRFALRHAQLHQKQRIIYIVPYTTIIEQNAQEVREVLQAEDYVLEHHSNVIEDTEHNENLSFKEYQVSRRLNTAKDDWDVPIIFTTMVQFLETFYSGKSRNMRRLHNLANSILIFDEVQSVPIHCVSLFNEALNFLKNTCNTTSILCTATQPALQLVRNNIKIDEELVEDLPTNIQAFKRTSITSLLKNKGWNTEGLSGFVEESLIQRNNVLVILNTKKAVRDLYEQLKYADFEVVHLSTGMCPAHRKKKIEEMRQKLHRKEKFVCISTQLIEAGVDISFECVIRSLAGLDSIAQAAGRCNRNGEVEIQDVYVFNHAEESLSKLPTIKMGGECSRYIMKDLQDNPALFGGYLMSTEAMMHYFNHIYRAFDSKLNYPLSKLKTTIYELLFRLDTDENKAYIKGPGKQYPLATLASYKTAFSHFEVIDAKTQGVLVPYGEGKDLISRLIGCEPIDDYQVFLKKAQQYSVNLFQHDFEALKKNNQLIVVQFGTFNIYVAKETAHDDQFGISVQGEAQLDDCII
ncbi:CRISPR-associated helicase Cas3' [Lysinibacillus sp. NPDC056232]|uniref:CRISPR-associated helicase Cas3' n=1 Tax=Lysinibacillus sp. NPDC056232 TaxID=3345756 RepID=UPI0035E27EF7